MLEASQLETLWTPRLQEAGKRAFKILEPEIDRIMREVYVFLLDVHPDDVTPDQIQRGLVKFENILKGSFSNTYLETQRTTTRLLIEKNIDFITYLMIYVIYHRECALCLTRHFVEVGKVDEDMLGAVHLAFQCDASVSMDSYFYEMELANRAFAEETTKKFNTRILNISQSIGGFSVHTKMLAINAAIEASRAGDTGKGFAVLAQEIRSVAIKIQTASGEIENLAVSDALH